MNLANWIDVTYELPKAYDDNISSIRVLATTEDGFIVISKYVYEYQHWIYHDGILDNVTAWQRLPEPFRRTESLDHASFKKAALAIPEVKREYDAIGELKKSDWISVKERLPLCNNGEDDYVWAYCEKSKQICLGKYWKPFKRFYLDIFRLTHEDVSHWQLIQMPEPPEEG